VEDGRPLIRAAADAGVPERTLRRWLAAYRDGGLPALARRHLGWGDYEGMANLYGT
jgi:Homeodomain-like domain